MKEETIALFKQKGIRLQLVEITKENIDTDDIPTDQTITYYQIRLNRIILSKCKTKENAKVTYIYHIKNIINQLELF